MKNKLLLTTALVGVAFAMPTMAAEEWDGKTSYLIPQGETLVLEENSLVENITNNADGIGGALSTSKPKNGVENPGTLIVKSGTVFKNNTAKYDGGAIANFGVLDIDGATFEANRSQTETTDSQPVGGGAISLGIDSKTTIKNTKFVNNETVQRRRIGTRRTINNGDITNGSHENHSLIISDSAFIGNKATGTTTDRADNKLQGGNGGAIANSFNNTQISNTVLKRTKQSTAGRFTTNPFTIRIIRRRKPTKAETSNLPMLRLTAIKLQPTAEPSLTMLTPMQNCPERWYFPETKQEMPAARFL